ncbi:MAG: PilT/PilU family type 4a pilus ATPase [Myxococcales bacterium]|nr:PilT/PilU family type 4a pilus ATPase [Myxococcales bacterium]
MKQQPVSADLLPKVVKAMSQSAIFRGIPEQQLRGPAQQAMLGHYAAREPMMKVGDRADGFGLLLNGSATLSMAVPGTDTMVEINRVSAMETFGEVEMLLGQPRKVAVTAATKSLVMNFNAPVVELLFERVPTFGMQLGKALAARVGRVQPDIPLRFFDLRRAPPSKEVVELLPAAFIARQRVLPVKSESGRLVVGFVDPLTRHTFEAMRKHIPGMEVTPVRIDPEAFRKLAQARGISLDGGGGGGGSTLPSPLGGGIPSRATGRVAMPVPGAGAPTSVFDKGGAGSPVAGGGVSRRFGARVQNNPRLDAMLKRMVAEGASDLHLCAGHRPRWRIDGEIHEISEAKVLGPETVDELFEPVMADRSLEEFESNDCDLAYAIEGVARFRVNLFRDRLGTGAVLRQIPDKILTFEQLGLPETVRKMCDHPKGMVLVTGPTGSGKSTTLAAMMDYINRTRRTHIITLEDPIEFVHKSRKSLVNQREVGEHTKSFKRALKAALREDPDIVLVGEMRDIETVGLALETANTGHLVFGTLHTATAISTVDRIIDLFPHEQQSQIRSTVADCLKGVISQTLCRKKGGGRIAALEILVGSNAISNLIREGKNHQIANIQMTAKKQGNQMLNEQLERLVVNDKVEYEEALGKSLDKPDFAKRFGREYFDS